MADVVADVWSVVSRLKSVSAGFLRFTAKRSTSVPLLLNSSNDGVLVLEDSDLVESFASPLKLISSQTPV